MKRLLLTGANGFVGSQLQPLLEQNKFSVMPANAPEFDLLNRESVARLVRSEKWDVVVHLAGLSHVPTCEKDLKLAREINVGGTDALINTLKESSPACHFVFASTAQVYAAPQGREIEEGVVFTEVRNLKPQNAYAQTKREAEELILNSKLKATVLRFFNHTHKTQPPIFFLPHIYQQLSANVKSIPVGNLDLNRDIGGVYDLVRAITKTIVKADWNFETFNICSGRAKNLRKLATLLAEQMAVKTEFVVDSSRLRPGEPTTLTGSHDKITKATGWKPEILTEEQLIKDFLRDYP